MTAPQQRPRRPAIRRDANGVTAMAPTWESLVERLIREAQEQGAFDDLPAHGRPIAVDDDWPAGDMALAFHMLRTAGAAPPWIEADKEVRRLRDARDAILTRARLAGTHRPVGPAGRQHLMAQLDRLMDEHDAAVARLNVEAPTLALHRRPLDHAAEQARLRVAMGIEVADDDARPSGAGGP